GNIATNAGGNRAVKYGTTRDQVYSLEVVVPDGGMTTLGARLNKKTAGYALEQLIMGSEGTLGIVTGATLKLKPLPPHKMDLLAIVTDYDSATRLVQKIITAGGIEPTSIEFMDNLAVRSCADYIKVRLPHYDDGHYVIITLDAFGEEELERRVTLLDQLCAGNGAAEVLEADEGRVWKARRSMADAARAESSVVYYEDVVVPVDRVADMLGRAAYFEKRYGFLCRIVAHAGDGNIHFTLLKAGLSDQEWHDKLDAFHEDIYGLAYKMGGRLSGEHGIGCKKIFTMKMYTDPVELALMKKIKKALDPNNILNPGKIFGDI
ncbi:MAG: FAD-binding protein, partial [Acidaminococcales bacterium]|nr:FAD-binding protein [Acidaminococcales bacterium]